MHGPIHIKNPLGYYSCSIKDKAVRAYTIKKYEGIRVIAPLILNLDTRLR
jgi:hypothetical protein